MIRRKTRRIFYRNLAVGDNAPISIQSMIKIPLKCTATVLKQISLLKTKGCELVRIAVPDIESAGYLKKIIPKSPLPVEADIHFNWKIAMVCLDSAVDGIRLNPGNIYRKNEIIDIAKKSLERNVPIRVGLNSGSAPQGKGTVVDRMVGAALDYIDLLQDLKVNNIIVSLKSSDVGQTVSAYRKLAKRTDCPFHLGVTATGFGTESIVKSSIGIGALLLDGIGDTIRVSFSGNPVEEVMIAKYILQSMGLRRFFPEVITCPTCGRCTIDVQGVARKVYSELLKVSKSYPNVLNLTAAVMGCVVNGPGEAKTADVGIAGGKGRGLLFVKGKPLYNIKQDDMVNSIIKQAISLCTVK